MKCTFQEKKGGPKCGVTCNSKQSMDIHVRGMHREGWNALCRKHYYWPAGKTKHEKKSTQCKAIKKKKCKEMIQSKGNLSNIFSAHYIPIRFRVLHIMHNASVLTLVRYLICCRNVFYSYSSIVLLIDYLRT